MNETLKNVGYISNAASCDEKRTTQQQRSPPPVVHHTTCLSLSLQDRLTVEAPKRHKVSVHVLSREMDSCEYL